MVLMPANTVHRSGVVTDELVGLGAFPIQIPDSNSTICSRSSQ
jgi:hypothetical protein